MANEITYERIQSLAKQSYETRIQEYKITKLEELIYDSNKYIESNIKDRQKILATKFFKPLLQQFTSRPEEVAAEINHYCGEGSMDICITVEQDEREAIGKLAGPKQAVGDLLKVSFCIANETRTAVYGYTGSSDYKANYVGKTRPDLNVVNLSIFFAGMYFYCEARQMVEELSKLSLEKQKKHENYTALMTFFEENSYGKKYPVKNRDSFCEEVETKVLQQMQREVKKKYPSESIYWRVYKSQTLTGFMQYQYAVLMDMLEGKRPFFAYADFVSYSLSEDKGWKLLWGVGPYCALEALLEAKDSQRSKVIQNYKSYQITNSEYTKSYQTRKAQSEKLKADIQNSRLWKYFGYVEYDESVDLEAISGYEKEFEDFYHRRLSNLDLSQNAIRFRKLGQHKAAGLYYPSVKCLCVDVHYPHSMIHELGHLIDYQYGGLSSGLEFKEIYDATKAHLDDLAAQDNELGKQLRGKTKYNKEYFLYPTEVFARSFEIYVHEIWKERLSLVPEHLEAYYDCSDEHLQRVKSYFDQISFELSE